MTAISAIGLSAIPSFTGAGSSPAVLDAQLSQFQAQLADWVNCSSCNTPEGKAKIAEISDKISDIKQRMKTAEAAKQPNQSTSIQTPQLVQSNSTTAPSSTSTVNSLGQVIGQIINIKV